MSLTGLLDLFHTSSLDSVLRELNAGSREQMVYGLSGSQRTFVIGAIRKETSRPVLVVTETLAEAERMAQDIESWLGEPTLVFPSLEVLPFEVVAQSIEMAIPRISVLDALVKGARPVVLAPLAALFRRLPPPASFDHTCIELRVGTRIDQEDVVLRMVLGGYEKVDMVESRGQFSRRGGILDIFPSNRDNPLRFELFDDELDSIREFDLASQRSLDTLDEARIPPARELVASPDGFDKALADIRRAMEAAVRKLEATGKKAVAQKLREKVSEHLENMETSRTFEGNDQYARYFYPDMRSLLDYLPRDTIIVVDEFSRLRESADANEKVLGEMYSHLIEQGSLLPGPSTIYYSLDDVVELFQTRQSLYFSLLLKRIQHADPQNIVTISARSAQVFHGQWPAFAQEVNRWKRQHYRIILATANRDRAIRLSNQLIDDGIENAVLDGVPELTEPGVVCVVAAPLEAGFEFPEDRLVVVTDGEIYGRPKKLRRPRATKEASRLTDYRELKVGDYVVHVSHGIGKYLGIRTLEIEKTQRDYLFVQYSGADALYVPTDQIHTIQKYVGAEGREPKLNKLGGTEWARVKHRVKESVREMAQELIRLYAIRESVKGFQFSSDTPWQKEFEDAFRYEETPDQLTAISHIKKDMERGRPMDHLLVGDVGYGKTEVAIRAAFKAVMDGKQVAVLVPTTILAQQHFNTFRERFFGFPIKIGMMSRFLTAKQQAEVAKAAKQGMVDIVIGTHRLLGSDVGFKDLGLLIIDEEHRFGVGHKEQIKQLRLNVDALTLTATPIPRTLSMAMSGIRDVSLIETPPEDRFPVQTYVVEYNEELIRDAIVRELARGGQVFYVHNRVQTIERAASRIQQLVPDSRILVGHGQMKEDKLEQVMMDFLNGEGDVLVCTTIIESGLDIANVNTMIVEDADHLGLAQLYQLRGRVGRSNRLAYAYFTYKRDKVLTEISEKRLSAIREFTELGSGFKLAMRDLEIRGAGNVLGAEQHGFIISVGFDLYVQLLDEAVREMKGEMPRLEIPPVSVDIAVDAFIPDGYVPDPRQKIDLYKKIAAIETLEDADDVAEELLDRFGSPPVSVDNLLTVSRVKVHARKLGVTSISQQTDRVTLKFATIDKRRVDTITGLVKGLRGRFTVPTLRVPALTMKVESPKIVLQATEQLLRRLDEVLH